MQHFRQKTLAIAAAALTTLATSVMAQDKPESIDIGVFTFMSGPAAAYGMPGAKGPKS